MRTTALSDENLSEEDADEMRLQTDDESYGKRKETLRDEDQPDSFFSLFDSYYEGDEDADVFDEEDF